MTLNEPVIGNEFLIAEARPRILDKCGAALVKLVFISDISDGEKLHYKIMYV